MEIKCPFWKVCGPAPIEQRLAQEKFPCGDPRRDYVAIVCDDENNYLTCEYYKIREKEITFAMLVFWNIKRFISKE